MIVPYIETIATKREAYAIVRSEADCLIEQATRHDNGYDRGQHRDDCPAYLRTKSNTIATRTARSVAFAFAVSAKFTKDI